MIFNFTAWKKIMSNLRTRMKDLESSIKRGKDEDTMCSQLKELNETLTSFTTEVTTILHQINTKIEHLQQSTVTYVNSDKVDQNNLVKKTKNDKQFIPSISTDDMKIKNKIESKKKKVDFSDSLKQLNNIKGDNDGE